MDRSGEQRAIRSLEAKICEQIEEVARAICEMRHAEKEARLLERFTSLLAFLNGAA
jgi:hypothetical protein